MNGMLRVPRSRGAMSGVLLILLGAWGGLVPFVGPTFSFAYTPDKAWVYNSGRFWLDILPAIAAIVGGLILLAASYRPLAWFGAWLAALSGAWFAVGPVLAPAWRNGSINAGVPVGGVLHRAAEQIGFFTGLGVVIMLFAALALGRLSVISVRDARLAERTAEAEAEEAAAAEAAVQARDTTPVPDTAPAASATAADTTTADPPRSSRAGRFALWNPQGRRAEKDAAATAPGDYPRPADQAAQARAAEDRAAEDRAVEDRAAEDRAAEARASEDRAAEDRAAEAAPGASPEGERLAGTATSSE